MKTSSSIEVISKMDIPVTALEKYINTNINRLKTKNNKSTGFNAVSHSFEKIDCCSAYVDVNGTVEICFKDGKQNNFRSVNVKWKRSISSLSQREEISCIKLHGELHYHNVIFLAYKIYHKCFIALQGLPTATTFAGIFLTTTLPAPMVVFSPIVTPTQ